MYGFEAMNVQREVDARAKVCLCSSLEGHAAQQILARRPSTTAPTQCRSLSLGGNRAAIWARAADGSPNDGIASFLGEITPCDDSKKPARSNLPASVSLSGGFGVFLHIQPHVTIFRTPTSMSTHHGAAKTVVATMQLHQVFRHRSRRKNASSEWSLRGECAVQL